MAFPGSPLKLLMFNHPEMMALRQELLIPSVSIESGGACGILYVPSHLC